MFFILKVRPTEPLQCNDEFSGDSIAPEDKNLTRFSSHQFKCPTSGFLCKPSLTAFLGSQPDKFLLFPYLCIFILAYFYCGCVETETVISVERNCPVYVWKCLILFPCLWLLTGLLFWGCTYFAIFSFYLSRWRLFKTNPFAASVILNIESLTTFTAS